MDMDEEEDFPLHGFHDMDFPSESWAASDDHEMDELDSSNLGSILDSLFGHLAMQPSREEDSASHAATDIHSLPSEIIYAIYLFLTSVDDRSNFRLTAKSICACLDESLETIRIVPSSLPESSLSYHNLTPTWTSSTKKLIFTQSNHGMWQWQYQKQANGPVFLMLMMLGPRLNNLTHLRIDRVGDFFLEVLLAIANLGISRSITHVEVRKQMLERGNPLAFWNALKLSFPSLLSLNLSGWMLDLVDVDSLAGLTNLESLHISNTSNLPETGLQCLSSLVNLKHLVIEALEYSSPIESEFNGNGQRNPLHSPIISSDTHTL